MSRRLGGFAPTTDGLAMFPLAQVLKQGLHPSQRGGIPHWCKSQTNVALSSEEAEFKSAGKGLSGLFSGNRGMTLHVDASACKGTPFRTGTGKGEALEYHTSLGVEGHTKVQRGRAECASLLGCCRHFDRSCRAAGIEGRPPTDEMPRPQDCLDHRRPGDGQPIAATGS